MSDDNKEGAGVPETWQHVANEWADMATSAIQAVRNIIDGISKPEDVLANLNFCYSHCAEVQSRATPPAVMPAAPSDAVRPCEYCDDTGDVHGLDGEWRGVCICPAGAALSQTMQPQAEHPVGDIPPISDVERGLTDAERRMLNTLFDQMSDLSDKDWRDHGFRRATFDRLQSKLRSLNYSVRPQAEPATGEQAGAVASESRCPNCDDTGDVNGITGEWRGVCHCPAGQAINARALAAPGAAIAAREQEVDALLFKLECFIDHATGGKLSKSSWSLETLKSAHDEHLNSYVNEAIAERAPDASDEAPAAPNDDEQLVATLIHCSREVSSTAMTGYDLASVLSRAAERIQFLTQPTTAQQAGPTDGQIRDGFRDYDKELVARHRTPWQIWRDSSAWTRSALKGMQPGERKEGAE